MYDAVGLDLTADAEAAMRRWLVERPREPARPAYAADDFGLTDEQIRERFAAYNARFRLSDTFEEDLMPTALATPSPPPSSTSTSWPRSSCSSTRPCEAAPQRSPRPGSARAKPSDAMRDCFDGAFEEVMFSAAVWSSNQDPLRPKVTCITRLEHEVDGPRDPRHTVGHRQPRLVYRVIPISGDERYEIRGRVGEHRMTENYFTLWDANMGTVDVLNGRTMEVEADGSFVITVDADPAGGRPNHVQSTPKAHEFYIRDVLLDWGRDDPNHLEVERLGGATVDAGAHARRAGRGDRGDDGALRRLHRQAQPRHVQDAAQPLPPRLVGRPGRRAAQPGVRGGPVRLEPDEAFVVDVNDGGADYFTVPLSNVWGTTLGHPRPHRQPQQGAVASPTPTAPTPTSSPPPTPACTTGSTRRAPRGHPHAADGRVPRRTARGGPRRARAGW